MKRFASIFFVITFLTLVTFYTQATTSTQEDSSITVDVGVICLDVVDREPVDPGNFFDTAVERLYCYTKIAGAENPMEITHVWYFGETERARITLSVQSSPWRTWSSKKIQAHEVGDWRVDVIDPDGEVLDSIEFKIVS